MAQSVAAAVRPTPAQTVGADLLQPKVTVPKVGRDLLGTATTANVTPDTGFLALIDEARVRCGWSQKQMAINAGVNEGTFSQALHGSNGKNFDPRWLDAQPIEYRIALADIIGNKFGVTRDMKRALVLRKVFDAIGELTALTEVSE